MKKLLIWIGSVICTMQSVATAEISGSVTASYSHFPHSLETSFEDDVSLELKALGHSDFSHWSIDYELVLRKSINDEGKDIIEPRELFVKRSFGDFDISVGNRQFFWGVTESKNVVDFVNQRDSAAGNSTEDKLGATSISTEFYLQDAEIQYVFMPYFRERTFNAQDAHPGLGVSLNKAMFSDHKGSMSGDHAVRYSNSFGEYDIGINGFYGTAREPILNFNNNGTATPYYPEYQALGLDVQFTGASTLYKGEFVKGYQDEIETTAYVLGFESTFYSIASSSWDIGLIGELQFDDRTQAAATRFNVGGLRFTANNASDSNFLVLYAADEAGEQLSYMGQFSHRLNNGLKLEAEYTEFYSSVRGLPFRNLIDDSYFQVSVGYYF